MSLKMTWLYMVIYESHLDFIVLVVMEVTKANSRSSLRQPSSRVISHYISIILQRMAGEAQQIHYRKRPNKCPGRLLGCPVSEEGEGAIIEAIYEMVW